MIEVSHLSRQFGNFRAVDDVSFSIPTGQIVGLLGPNGAGKTTTMRMICGFLGATSGSVKIDELEAAVADLAAKYREAIGPKVEELRAKFEELVETVKEGGAIDPKQFYYVTTPKFEVYDESLAWMTKKIFVCDAVRLPDAVLLTYYTVEQVNDHPALG